MVRAGIGFCSIIVKHVMIQKSVETILLPDALRSELNLTEVNDFESDKGMTFKNAVEQF